MRIATRLAWGCGALVLLVAAMALLGGWMARSAHQAVGGMYQSQLLPLAQLKQVYDAYVGAVLDTSNQATLGLVDPAQASTQVEQGLQRAQTQWRAFAESPAAQAHSDAVRATEQRMVQAQKPIANFHSALKQGDMYGVSQSIKELDDAIRPIGGELNVLMNRTLREGEQAHVLAQERYERSLQSLALVLLVAVVSAAAIAWMLARSITRPLQEAVQVARTVARGELNQPIEVRDRSETGALLQALLEMQQSLVTVVHSVRSGSEGVAHASAEIASGNLDLSQRTEQQASALQDTSAAMHRLESTVGHNADSAEQASSLASGACQVASQGGAVVDEVVCTMRAIHASSARIADITGVIDAIAFQTNILALNAAVEAARAGEQGRGFAVVAAEVRTLAQRSAAAAKEIKDLIGASVSQVERGSALADRAGQTMGEVVQSIDRVSALVQEISQASRQQAQAAQAVGCAVTDMDRSTQQNAALVEQMAAAADGLRGLAQDQVQAVAVFTLPAATESHRQLAWAR
ncbi:MAG: hypothetical protein QG643_2112 [Pseudomonadota bacterium]|nr:hypothetical protein [Pseudomonadota bacterium]